MSVIYHSLKILPFLRSVNPFMLTVPTFAVRETDVSRHNGGTSGTPLKALRVDSALRALSTLRDENASVGKNGLNKPLCPAHEVKWKGRWVKTESVPTLPQQLIFF